jgi:uncharacterized protein YaaR (DUF327 family)
MKKLILISLIGTHLTADMFHYQHLIQGDSSTALGGAYTALSQDNVGMYNNPAGFVYSKDSLSTSIQAYQYSEFVYKRANTETGEDYTKTSEGIFPTMFSHNFDKEYFGGKIGLSILTEDHMKVSQNETTKELGTRDYSEISLQQNYDVINAGLTYSRMLSDKLSFGTSLYGVMKTHKYINKQFLYWNSRGEEVQNIFTDSLYGEDKQYGIKPIVGLLYKANKFHSFGISLQKDMILSRDYKTNYSYFSKTQSIYVTQTSNETPQTPYNINLGYAYRDKTKTIAFDIKYYSAVNKKTYGDIEMITTTFNSNGDEYSNTTTNGALQTFDTVTQEVINISIGGSYKLPNSHSINIGLFTDFSKINDKILQSGNYQDSENIDMFGGTLSYSFPIAKKQATIGVLYSQGDGEANIGMMNLFTTNDSDTYTDVSQKNFMAFINLLF